MKKSIAIILLGLSISACGATKQPPVPREAYFHRSDFTRLIVWEHDNHLVAFETFKNSCKVVLKKKIGSKISGRTDIGGHASDWAEPCKEAMEGSVFNNKLAQKFFEKWFVPYEIHDKAGSHVGKFTGYYEIELNGSLRKSKRYKYPIYKRPSNLDELKGSSELSHAAINRGSLAGKNLEIAWVDSKARLFFMHIQGSGVVRLQEGGEMKLGYDGQNGFGYTAIGPMFKNYANEKISSALDMMRWLDKNPELGLEIMENNESFVFFKELHGSGPIGGQGIHLTPQRSMAIDAGLFPYSTPLWLETTLPKTSHFAKHNYHRLFIAQDTGGAIKGAIRGDVFFGRGAKAEELAAYMNQPGRYYMLFPKTVKLPHKYVSK